MNKINVAIVGHVYTKAMSLISLIEKTPEINLIEESIGDTDGLEYTSFQIGMNGQKFKLFPVKCIDIFLKYENLIIIDFTREKENIDFYKEKRIRHLLPGDVAEIKSIIELILLY